MADLLLYLVFVGNAAVAHLDAELIANDRLVREQLGHDCLFGAAEREDLLIRLGDQLFPAYHRILDDPDSTLFDLAGVFDMVGRIKKGDRSSFLEPAVASLAHNHVTVRRTALRLVLQIGSIKETPAIVAMLSDKEWTLSIEAAQALAEMGDQRTLAAMNVWLNAASDRKPDSDKLQAELRKRVTKSRDDLKARLEKAKPPGK